VLDALKKMHDGSMDRLRRARKAKVTIVAGSDAYVATELADRGKEALLIFGAYAEAGMSPLEIIRAATTNAAGLLGLPAGTATLEAGSVADLLVVRGDALADIGALERTVAVVKAGRVVRREAATP
jgi:imidazolonepropionase-like amidohydrolase